MQKKGRNRLELAFPRVGRNGTDRVAHSETQQESCSQAGSSGGLQLPTIWSEPRTSKKTLLEKMAFSEKCLEVVRQHNKGELWLSDLISNELFRAQFNLQVARLLDHPQPEEQQTRLDDYLVARIERALKQNQEAQVLKTRLHRIDNILDHRLSLLRGKINRSLNK